MGKRKNLTTDKFIEEAISNVRDDRAMASTLLVELTRQIFQSRKMVCPCGISQYIRNLYRNVEDCFEMDIFILKNCFREQIPKRDFPTFPRPS